MALTTVREVLGKASAMLQDTAPQYNLHTEREMVGWLNDAQVAVTMFLPSACSRVDVVRLKPGTRQSIEQLAPADVKVGGGAAPAQAVQGVQVLDLLCNMGADGATPGRAIPQPVDRRLLDTNRPNWRESAGTAVRQYCFDPRFPKHFFVEPGVPADRLWVEMAYTALPLLIPAGGEPGHELYGLEGSSALIISVGDENVIDLVNYICARAFLKKADASQDDVKATQYTNLFLGSINARVTAITGVNPNLKRLPMAPEPVGAAS